MEYRVNVIEEAEEKLKILKTEVAFQEQYLNELREEQLLTKLGISIGDKVSYAGGKVGTVAGRRGGSSDILQVYRLKKDGTPSKNTVDLYPFHQKDLKRIEQ